MPFKTKKQYRLPAYDYSSNGYYFITICTKNRALLFGNIVAEKMVLSPLGKIAKKCWSEIPQHFPSVQLDTFVVMPNHIHGIIALTRDLVGTRHGASLPKQNTFGPLPRESLASIVNHFKGAVTKHAKNLDIPTVWQSRFYDHIIRNEQALSKIREYILFNPNQWDIDKNIFTAFSKTQHDFR